MKLLFACALIVLPGLVSAPDARAKNLHEYYGSSWSCKMMSVGVAGYDLCTRCEAKGEQYDDTGSCVPKAGGSSNRAYNPERDSLRNRLPSPAPTYSAPSDSTKQMHGAVAATLHKKDGRVFVATGVARDESKEKAGSSAVAQCAKSGLPGCAVVGTWNAGCGYITQGTKVQEVTWATGKTPQSATESCQKGGFTCTTPIGYCVN